MTENKESIAILVGVYQGNANRAICEEHLDELENLADTFEVPVIEKVCCSVRKIDVATYLSKGKVEEIIQKLEEHQANLMIFDEEISPSQQRNLEKALKVAVMDRTELILEIFAQRAQTKEAKLQIELARTKYEFPRLKRLWSHFSRQRAKGGFLKGEGEKQLEIDKRLIKKRLEKLSRELEEVKSYRQTQSAARRRSGVPTLAIVGYTNAGKSTLLNALTKSNDVLVEDKLFATLDPTTRKFTLPNNQDVLLTDTVGFIRKLPHSLVAAFRSTLEAALHDDLLIHLVDVSHPLAYEHAQTTCELLKELGADNNAMLTVLNKVDACENREMIDQLRLAYPKTVEISALSGLGFDLLAQLITQELSERRKTIKLRIPQKHYTLVASIRREGHVFYEEYEDNDVVIRAEIPIHALHQFDEYMDEN